MIHEPADVSRFPPSGSLAIGQGTERMTSNDPLWRDAWPEGLDRAEFTMFADGVDYDDTLFLTQAAQLGIPIRSGAGRFANFLTGTDASAGFLARVSFEPFEDEGKTRKIELDLRPLDRAPEVFVRAAKAAPIEEFLAAAARGFRRNTAELVAYVSGEFELPRELWRPTIDLPMAIPSFGAVADATPEVEGFEFSYPDLSSPLRKARISVASEDSVSVSMMIREAASEPTTIVPRACNALRSYLKLFAYQISQTHPEPRHEERV